MAPRSGCHEARGDRSGSAQVGSMRANADRGGSLARRRIESSDGCARASKHVRQKLDVRVLAPSKRHAGGSLQGGPAWRGQELAEWEHLTRSKTEREPTKAKRDQRSHRRGVILEVSEIRDESPPRGARLLPKGSGARIDSDGRRLLANEIGVSVTARRWEWPRWFKPVIVRLRGRRARRGITTETSEAKIVTTASGEELDERSRGPAKASSPA